MNDQLLMDNYLMLLKSTIEVYIHGTLESSNKDIRETLKKGLAETLIHQANTYDKMTEYNWYQINNIAPKDINKTLNQLCNKDTN